MFYSLTVNEVKSLTPNSVAITFSIPSNLNEVFSFTSGQYITIKHIIKNEEIRRAYSISSSPKEKDITVGIKKVTGGIFSEYANSEIKIGDVLEVMPPEGRFVYTPANSKEDICAFAAGSGITPIMSIAKTVLSSHSENTFSLVYGNKSLEETMFYKELVQMLEAYKDRFFIQFVTSRAKEDDCLFGRIDLSNINYIIKNKFDVQGFKSVYLCGPEGMINVVTEVLKSKGVEESSIYHELFTSSEEESSESSVSEGNTSVSIVLDDEIHTFDMNQSATILDAVLEEGLDAPYSCQGGVCSTCIARITEGEAKMEKNQILTDGEINEGLVLTCQAHPTTSSIKVDYDDV
ncbi:MAG: ferredoxin--NADP reductase [Eudoraea sp.]